MDLVYKTLVLSQGGRNGRVQSADGTFKLNLAQPKEMGGTKEGANPEQLFAAAYAACFENSIRHIVRLDKLPLKGVFVEAEISMYVTFEGQYRLALSLTAIMTGVDQPTADSLVERAFKVCPYTDATKNNISVKTLAILEDPVQA